MNASERKKIKKEMMNEILNSEEFRVKAAKEIMSVPCADVGLQAPGTLLEFFRSEWLEEATSVI